MKYLFFFTFILSATLLSANDNKSLTWDRKAVPVKNDPQAMSIATKSFVFTSSKNYYKVDPKKKYCLSGKFKLQTPIPSKPGKLKFGIQTFDKYKRPILSEQTTTINNSTSTLLAAAEYGQRSVKIANNKKWILVPNFSYIAFNAKDDYSDVPNRSVVAIAAIEKKGNFTEIVLKEPLREFFPAKSQVRLHQRLASFLYGGALNKALTGEYVAFSGVFTGEQRSSSNNIFRQGTCFVQLIVMLEGQGTLLFKDIKFEEVK
jgi:hypothetical protein